MENVECSYCYFWPLAPLLPPLAPRYGMNFFSFKEFRGGVRCMSPGSGQRKQGLGVWGRWQQFGITPAAQACLGDNLRTKETRQQPAAWGGSGEGPCEQSYCLPMFGSRGPPRVPQHRSWHGGCPSCCDDESFPIRIPHRRQGCHGEEGGVTSSDVCGGEGVQTAVGNVLYMFGGVRREKGNTGGSQ